MSGFFACCVYAMHWTTNFWWLAICLFECKQSVYPSSESADTHTKEKQTLQCLHKGNCCHSKLVFWCFSMRNKQAKIASRTNRKWYFQEYINVLLLNGFDGRNVLQLDFIYWGRTVSIYSVWINRIVEYLNFAEFVQLAVLFEWISNVISNDSFPWYYIGWHNE